MLNTTVTLGITTVIFVSLLAAVASIMDGAMSHTGDMLSSMQAYSENPTETNRISMEKDVESTNNYIGDISSVSSEVLIKYLDAVDSSILSDGEKESLIESKEFLQKIEKRDPTDPEAIALRNKMNQIFERVNTIEQNRN